jgi:hypothetical protein
MNLRAFLSFLPGLLLALPPGALAGGEGPEQPVAAAAKVVKAAYVYNFTKFVDWGPEEGASNPPPPITICVIGNDPVGSALDEVATLQAKGRPIKVLHVTGRENVPPCHILYVSSSEEPQLPRILSQVEKAAVLTVSDIPHFVEQGGMIGFVPERGRVRIEINLPRARAAGLTVSSKLLEIARNLPAPKP